MISQSELTEALKLGGEFSFNDSLRATPYTADNPSDPSRQLEKAFTFIVNHLSRLEKARSSLYETPGFSLHKLFNSISLGKDIIHQKDLQEFLENNKDSSTQNLGSKIYSIITKAGKVNLSLKAFRKAITPQVHHHEQVFGGSTHGHFNLNEGRYSVPENRIPLITDQNEIQAIKNSKVCDPKLFDSLDLDDESYKLVKLTGSYVHDFTEDFRMSPVSNLES